MRTPIFLNESRNPGQLGDLRVFDDADGLRAGIEAVDVENGEYAAYDAEGRLLSLLTDGKTVSVRENEPQPTHAADLTRLLREALVTSRYPDGRAAAPPAWCEAAPLDQLVARSLDVEHAWQRDGRHKLAAKLVETARRWLALS
jgi:hypothetical protein